MEIINLNSYFSVDSYGDDKDKLFKINLITKTRDDPKKKYITEHYGIEQSFLIYSLAKKYKCTNFVEIGTGRGTASYAVSLLNSVKRVDTFDIIPFDKKNNTAVEFRPFYGSNKDLYNLIPCKEKEKINFFHIDHLNNDYKERNKSKFDIAFIDGNHSNYNIIMNDFLNCLHLTKEDGIIVFDDYGNFPAVTRVVNDIIKKHTKYKYLLVQFRGHYFMKEKMEKGSGEMILFKNPSLI